MGGLLIVLFVSLFYMRMSICCLLLACLFLVLVGFGCDIWFMLLILVWLTWIGVFVGYLVLLLVLSV